MPLIQTETKVRFSARQPLPNPPYVVPAERSLGNRLAPRIRVCRSSARISSLTLLPLHRVPPPSKWRTHLPCRMHWESADILLLILGRCTTIQDSICCKLCGKEYKNTIWLDRHEHKCKVASTAMTVIGSTPEAAPWPIVGHGVEECAQMLLEPTNPMRDALARVWAARVELEAAQAALSACVQRYEAATGPSRKAARRE